MLDWRGRGGGERGGWVEVFDCCLWARELVFPGLYFSGGGVRGEYVHRGICLPKVRMSDLRVGVATEGQWLWTWFGLVFTPARLRRRRYKDELGVLE